MQNIDRVVIDGRILKGEHGSEDASVFERRRKSETAYEQKCDCGTKNGYEAANVLCDCNNENSALIRLINRLIEAGLRDKFIFMKGHLFDKVSAAPQEALQPMRAIRETRPKTINQDLCILR